MICGFVVFFSEYMDFLVGFVLFKSERRSYFRRVDCRGWVLCWFRFLLTRVGWRFVVKLV